MRNTLRKYAFASGVALAALAAASPLGIAQVAPTGSTSQRQPVPRLFLEQTTHYIRTTFAFNSCVQVSLTCTVKITTASLPYNAAVLRVTAVVHTAFNSGTTDSITLGTTAANANEISSAGCSLHAQGLVACTVLAGASSATGNTAAQSGFNGGIDLFLKYTTTGAAATAGLAAIVTEYIAPNDGLCAPVPLGAAPAGC